MSEYPIFKPLLKKQNLLVQCAKMCEERGMTIADAKGALTALAQSKVKSNTLASEELEDKTAVTKVMNSDKKEEQIQTYETKGRIFYSKTTKDADSTSEVLKRVMNVYCQDNTRTHTTVEQMFSSDVSETELKESLKSSRVSVTGKDRARFDTMYLFICLLLFLFGRM